MRALALIVALVACGASTPQLPSQGGDPWVEITSEHFVMWTDAPVTRGRELVNEMEKHRQIVVRAMNNATTAKRAFVLAFRNDTELHAYVKWFVGKAFSNTPLLEPMIVISAFAANDHDDTLTHELTHLISYSLIRHQPHWLAEGIATFFGSAEDLGGRVEVGKPRRDYAELIRKRQLVPVAKMFACNDEGCIDYAFYATAWAMFAFLVNKYPDQLGIYLARVNELPYKRRDEAWTEAFPNLPPETFDHELAAWLAFGDIRLPRFDIKLHDTPTTVRKLADADVLIVRALAEESLVRDPVKANAEVDAALAADPTSLAAYLIRWSTTRAISPADARALTTAHAGDWRAWFLLAVATQPSEEANGARDKACELAKQDPGVETPDKLCEH